jgi:hypothetical protein
MLICLGRHHTKFACAILGAILGAVIAAALSGLVSDVQAGEERLAKAGQAGRPILIREHAAWDADCAAVPYPALRLDVPPRHGAVCARIENIKVHSLYAGTEAQCVGHVVRGLRLFYFPQAGYAGADGLRYSVQYPSVHRSVSVSVAGPPGAADASATGITGALPPLRQAPGPVPECLGQVS